MYDDRLSLSDQPLKEYLMSLKFAFDAVKNGKGGTGSSVDIYNNVFDGGTSAKPSLQSFFKDRCEFFGGDCGSFTESIQPLEEGIIMSLINDLKDLPSGGGGSGAGSLVKECSCQKDKWVELARLYLQAVKLINNSKPIMKLALLPMLKTLSLTLSFDNEDLISKLQRSIELELKYKQKGE